MKKSLFAGLFVAASFAAFSQTAAAAWQRLQALEGTWYLNDRRQLVFSIWQKNGENLLENRTFTLICGDTVELSRARLEFSTEKFRLALHSDSLQMLAPEAFWWEKTDDGGERFLNENAAAPHPRMGWDFFGENYFALSIREGGMDKTSDFRRHYPRITRFDLRLRYGLNTTTLASRGTLYGRQEFAARPGFEVAIGAFLRSLEGPLRLGVEVGFLRRQIHVESELPYGGGVYRNGDYQRTDFSFAFLPEIQFGESGEWRASAGVYAATAFRRSFSGKVKIRDAEDAHEWFAQPNRDLRADWGFSLGLARQIGGQRWAKNEPTLYLRGTLGNNNVDNLYFGDGALRARSLTAGFSVRLLTL